jgi:uncharacterized protein
MFRPQGLTTPAGAPKEELMNFTGLPLTSTFIHLPGIGLRRERELWSKGILDWHQFQEAVSVGKLSQQAYRNAVIVVRASLRAVEQRDVTFFTALLPQCEMWRLFPHFVDDTLFLDIETTGFTAANNDVTLIATLTNRRLALFVNGVNLADFPSHVAQYPLLVTFNGSQFDLPFLRTHFPAARWDRSHIDIRSLLASLGYKGGLKVVEGTLGIRRDPSIQDVTGLDAARLWYQYRLGDDAALQLLALYNLTDAAHLAQLLTFAIMEKIRELEFPGQVITCDSQQPLQSCREYLSEWLTKCRDLDASARRISSLGMRRAGGSGSA